MTTIAGATLSRTGRRPVTSRAELEAVCLDLFVRHGFDAVSVDDIADAAGIGRRTFFRYFPSKNDAVWGDFDTALVGWRSWFDAAPESEPPLATVRAGVLRFNDYDAAALRVHRQRMRVILGTPALQAHSTLRYAAWREVVSTFVARRLGQRPTDPVPRVVGHVALACALSAYEQWLHAPGRRPLTGHLAEAMFVLDDRLLPDPAPRPVGTR